MTRTRPRRYRLGSLLAVVALFATMLAFGTTSPAGATDVTPTGLIAFDLTAGFLRINAGEPNEQFFDLSPSGGAPQCSDGIDNNDAPPLNVGSDGLTDYPADPQCTSPEDNSELAPGFQPVESVVVAATVNAAGTLSIPKNVRASETEARTLGGIYFPPGYVPDATLGMITARFQPAPGANVNTPATGTINVDTGTVTLDIAVRIKLEGGSGLTALGNSCFIPSGNNGIPLAFTTGTTAPPGPNQPISGSPYNRNTGDYTVVNNSFAVGTAGTCALIGLGNDGINSAFGLPAAGGRNTASFTFQANPKLNYLPAAPVADAGPDQFAHLEELTTLDSSASSDANGDPISYSWTQTDGPAVTLEGADTANPTFTTGDTDASYTFEVEASSRDLYLCPELPELEEEEELPEECEEVTDTDQVTVTSSYNVVPVADAGPDQSDVSVGSLASLDGTGSSDANLDELTYAWTQTSGPSVSLTDADTATPSFTTPATGPATLTFDLTVTDGFIGGTSTDSVTVEVIANQAPTANAGPDQSDRKTGQTVTLDGTGSTDPDGHALTYEWTQVSGHPVVLSDATSAQPTFVVPAAPDFVYPHAIGFELKVADSFGGADTVGDTVAIQVTPTVPTVTGVSRSPSGTVFSGDLITLSATVNNPDGGNLTYNWSQATGKTTSLSANNVANPTFNVPANGTNAAACGSGTGATSPTSSNCPRFQVQVTNAETGAGPGANVALAAYASTAPGRPVANAGPDDYVKVSGGTVVLDGTASSQAQGRSLTYQWTQTLGDAVTLSSATAAQPSFEAPATEQTLRFSLVATDPLNPIISGTNQQSSVADTVDIRVVPDRVVANAGPDQTGRVSGQTVTLTAAASTEPDQGPLFYEWEQLDGPTATLSDPTSVSPTFAAPTVTGPTGYTMTFQVTVTNGGEDEDDTDVDTVTISVVRSTPTVTVSRAPSGTVFTGDTVTLNANITNPDGTNPADYTYAWTQASGRTTSLSANNVANPTFIAPTSGSSATTACTSGTGTTSPTSANCPRFTVVVTNTVTGAVSTASSLAAYSSTLPGRPTANAGPAQSVTVDSNVILSGSGTQAQNRPLTYAWTQTAGPAVTLSGADTTNPTFTAPSEAASLTFQLITTDPLNPVTTGNNQKTSLASTVTVTVQYPPEANAGPDQEVESIAPVTLDGSASSDPDDAVLSYSWSQTSGPSVVLTGANTANPTFTAPVGPASLEFTLTVNDGRGGIDTDTVTVTVTAPEDDTSVNTVFRTSPNTHKAFTKFYVDVTNVAGPNLVLPSSAIDVSVTVNGEDASDVVAVVATKTIRPGLVGRYLLQWNHGLGLRADDVIEITSCVELPQDQNPANNCSTVSFPTGDVDLTATALGPTKIGPAATSSIIRLKVANNSTDRVILWPDNAEVTITVNGEPTTATVTNTAPNRGRIVRVGKTTTYSFKWLHGGLQTGDFVEATVCIPNSLDINPGDNCATLTRTVI